MGFSMTCDSCGKQIPGPESRVWMQIPSGQGDAGVSIDLCLDCGAEATGGPKVKKAKDSFVKRRDAANAAMVQGRTN